MKNFIVVHVEGKEILANTAWIEEIRAEDNKTTIYYAFQASTSYEQDYITVDESIEDIKKQLEELA